MPGPQPGHGDGDRGVERQRGVASVACSWGRIVEMVEGGRWIMDGASADLEVLVRCGQRVCGEPTMLDGRRGGARGATTRAAPATCYRRATYTGTH